MNKINKLLKKVNLAKVALISFAITSSATTIAQNFEPDLTEVTLRLKWIHQAQFAGFYAAQELGLYKKAGLKVNILPGGVDFPSVQMIASGNEEFGITGADQILIAREKGIKVQALGAIYRTSPFALFTLEDSNIKTLEDLKGKLTGVKLGGNEELTYRAMLHAAGIEKGEIREMPVKYDLSPLLEGVVQAWPGYVINEVISAKEQGYNVNVITPKQYGINFYADTLFAKSEYIKSNPEIVKAFVHASFDGWKYAIQHPEQAAEFGLKYSSKLNLDHEIAMMKASIPLLNPNIKPLGKMDEIEWEKLQKQLLDINFLDNKIDATSVFTNDFIEVE